MLFGSRFVFSFTEPSSTPPLSNTSAPLNISSTGQSKAGGLILNTGGATNGLIVQSGNVGIGTQNPGVLLEIKAPTINEDPAVTISPVARFFKSSPLQAFLQIGISDTAVALQAGSYSGGGHNIDMIFSTRGPQGGTSATQERMRITSDGNIGIGISNPVHRLEVGAGNIAITDANKTGYFFITEGNCSSFGSATIAIDEGLSLCWERAN